MKKVNEYETKHKRIIEGDIENILNEPTPIARYDKNGIPVIHWDGMKNIYFTLEELEMTTYKLNPIVKNYIRFVAADTMVPVTSDQENKLPEIDDNTKISAKIWEIIGTSDPWYKFIKYRTESHPDKPLPESGVSSSADIVIGDFLKNKVLDAWPDGRPKGY